MRSAIVGCGSIATVHAACIKKIEGNELVAVADIKYEKAAEFSVEYGGKPYASLEQMLSEEEIDVLHICTPHYLHTPMAVYALTHGVNVFMEKPPVISFAQLEELKAVSTDKKLGFCFQNRYNRSVQKAKEILASGEAGRILGARGMVTWDRPKEYYTNSDWRGKLETEGGGALINQSVHTLDLLHYFIGETPKTIDAAMTNHHLKDAIEVEDTISAYITYPDAKVCFYATTAYAANVPPIIELECENMRIRIEDTIVTCFMADGTVNRIDTEQGTALGKQYWGTGHEACIRDFYDSLDSDRSFRLELTEIESTIRLMLLVYESARTGHEVSYN